MHTQSPRTFNTLFILRSLNEPDRRYAKYLPECHRTCANCRHSSGPSKTIRGHHTLHCAIHGIQVQSGYFGSSSRICAWFRTQRQPNLA